MYCKRELAMLHDVNVDEYFMYCVTISNNNHTELLLPWSIINQLKRLQPSRFHHAHCRVMDDKIACRVADYFL